MTRPPDYLVAHVVTALAEDPRTHLLGIEVVAQDQGHGVRLAGPLDSSAQHSHVLEVVATAAPGCPIVDDLVIVPAQGRGVGEEFL